MANWEDTTELIRSELRVGPYTAIVRLDEPDDDDYVWYIHSSEGELPYVCSGTTTGHGAAKAIVERLLKGLLLGYALEGEADASDPAVS